MKLGIGSFAYAWAIGVAGFRPPSPLAALELVDRAAGLGVHLVQIGDDPTTVWAASDRHGAGMGAVEHRVASPVDLAMNEGEGQ